MNYKHNLECGAPICAGDTNPQYKKEVVWHPGEVVCQKKPYQKFQRLQARINRYVQTGRFKHQDRYWTADMLEKRTAVVNAKGGNPER